MFLQVISRQQKRRNDFDPSLRPLTPEGAEHMLADLATERVGKSGSLAARLSPILRTSVGDLVRSMICYYSNLIEGQDTHPIDIDQALSGRPGSGFQSTWWSAGFPSSILVCERPSPRRWRPPVSRADELARIRIVLLDVTPQIWRTIEVPSTASLRGLHDAIQVVVPFDNRHLFLFEIGDRRYGIPDREWGDDTRDAKNIRIGALIDRGVTELTYTYDFGDDWRFHLTIEEVLPVVEGESSPRLVGSARRGIPREEPQQGNHTTSPLTV